MNPQMICESETRTAAQAEMHLTSDLHLTSDQMSDLLACATSPQDESLELETATARAEAHLRTCATCAAEYASLREALSVFRDASTALADRELSRLQPLSRPAFPVLPARGAYSQTLFWMAASAILMAGILPLEMRWQRPLATPPIATASASVESDEALLEDIDRELSASVPAPMQALSDPTGDASAAGSQSQASSIPQDPASSQRKD
jgi:hypothetical protein